MARERERDSKRKREREKKKRERDLKKEHDLSVLQTLAKLQYHASDKM